MPPLPDPPDDVDDIFPTQTLSVEIQPIGAIFGTPNPVLVDKAPGRRLPLWRKPAPAAPAEAPLLADLDFRMLWLSRLLSQTAQGALLYALLILVVDLSDMTIFTSLFVICSIIPSIVFGLPAGLVADSVPRRGLLVLLNLFRFAFMLLLVGPDVGLPGVFAATLGIWIIHQFYSPAEASALADIVEPRALYLRPGHVQPGADDFAGAWARDRGAAPVAARRAAPRLHGLWHALAVAGAFAALLPALNGHDAPPALQPIACGRCSVTAGGSPAAIASPSRRSSTMSSSASGWPRWS